MRPGTTVLLIPMALALAGGVAAPADDAEPDPLEEAVPLKLDVVFSRYQGDTKISRLPFTLLLNSDNELSRMKMGLMVPLNVRTEAGKGPPTVMFKDVATGVECRARPLSGERFALRCEFYQDSVYDDRDTMPDKAELAPAVRRFGSETTLVLRDGQTAQHSATDPLTGDVLEVDATLSVVK